MLVRIAVLMLAVVALPVLAQSDRFAAADSDGNGTLSRTEMQRALPKLAPEFDRIDRNRDGSVSREELTAHLQGAKPRSRAGAGGGLAEHFQRADTDSDGALSRGECDRNLPRLATKFDQIDRDRDGRLTREELKAWFDGRRAARGKSTGGS
jgi:Ca2+-binding EF-hand superfamily protein